MIKKKRRITDSVFGMSNKLYRFFYSFIYFIFIRFSFVPFFKYRSVILRVLGASIENSRIYPSCTIWSPINLCIGSESTIGPRVKVYNQGFITVGKRVVISQDVTLCASTHDYNDPLHPLVLAPIAIHDDVWICAEAFVGPGVTVGEGAVIGARAVLTKDAEPWSVYAGNPAKKIKERKRFHNE